MFSVTTNETTTKFEYLVLRLVPLVSLAGAGFRVFWFLTGDGAGVGAAAATAFSGADFFLL